MDNCESTFDRNSDQKWRILSIHGQKQSYLFLGFKYKIGQVNKMDEHWETVHGTARQYHFPLEVT